MKNGDNPPLPRPSAPQAWHFGTQLIGALAPLRRLGPSGPNDSCHNPLALAACAPAKPFEAAPPIPYNDARNVHRDGMVIDRLVTEMESCSHAPNNTAT